MEHTIRPIRGKKLLVAAAGVGSLTFAFCGLFPGCNLMPPPSCAVEPLQPACQDLAAPTDGAACTADSGVDDGGKAQCPGGDLASRG